jgi:salicylate hydroxylase
LRKGVAVDGIREEGGRAVVMLSDGSRETFDLVIGADGTGSKVRGSLFPDFRPKILSTVCFQMQVSEEFMQGSKLRKVVQRSSPALNVWSAPGRCTFTAHGILEKLFDLQAFDMECTLDKDPHPEVRLGWVEDMEPLRQRFADHFPGLTEVLDEVKRYYKWRLVEVFGLPSWSNESGNVVLVGDSAHGMTPYAGQGSAMGIEDGAVIAEVLEGAESGDDLRDRLQLYEKIRRPRCESAQKYASTLGRLWSAKDERIIARVRGAAMLSNDPAYLRVEPDQSALFHSPAYEKWLDLYDASLEVRKAMESRAQARL